MRRLSALAVMVLVTACSCKRPDDHIAAEIQVRLATDVVTRPYTFDIGVGNGVVRLRGETSHHEEHQRVLEIVRTISGVNDVVADLRISDHILQQRVLDLLSSDPILQQSAIAVTAVRGRIRLESSATNAATRARAIMLAKSIYGVVGIDDHMR